MKQENANQTQIKKVKENGRKKKTRRSFREILNTILNCKSLGQLIFRCVMMILVPYLYLYVCGIIDSLLLRTGFTGREGYILFVFFTLMIFWAIGFTLAGMSIYRWVKRKNKANK